MNYMRYFISKCESVVDAFIIVRISVQFGDHFCTHAQRGRFWMVKKRQLKCPYGWRRGRLVCDLRMSGINDPALRTGRSGKSKGFGRRQAYVNPDMYDPRIVERGAMGISASGRPSAGYAVVSAADIWSPPAQHNGDWTCLRRVVERETVVVVQ